MSFREILVASRRALAIAAFALVAGLGTSPVQAMSVSAGSTITVSYDRPFFILLLFGVLSYRLAARRAAQPVLAKVRK